MSSSSSSAFIPFLGPEKTQYLMNSVRAKLMSLNVYSDETLLEYIMVLLANNHTKEKVYEELVLFMEPALTEQFVIWLFLEVEQLLRVPVQQPVQPQNNFVAAPVEVPQVQPLQSMPVQSLPVVNEPLLANDVQMGAASSNSAPARNRSFTKALESVTSQPSKQQQQQPYQQQTRNSPRSFSQAESKPEASNRRSSTRLATQQQQQRQRSRSPKRASSDRIVSRGDAPRSVNVDEGGRVQKIRLSVDFERDERRHGRKRIDDAPKATGNAPSTSTIKTKCQYWPNCKAGAACPNVHPSEPCKHFPNCSKGDACTYLHPVIPCRFQERCTNPLCNYQHRAPMAMSVTAGAANGMVPSAGVGASAVPMQTSIPMQATMQMPAQVPIQPAANALSSIPCRFHPRCINPSCPYLHPIKVACRYGVECTRPDCHFEHPEGRKSAAKSAIYQPCRYGKQCTRVDCPYLHDANNVNGAQMDISSSLPTDAQMNNN